MHKKKTISPTSNIHAKTPQFNKCINEKVKHQLTELYHSMRGASIQSSKSINSINKADAEDSKSFSSHSPKKVTRIKSFSPEKKQSALPQRSGDFYGKLQSYYKRKHDDSNQNIMDKKKGLANRLFRITSQFHRQIEMIGRSNSPTKKDMLRVPSLLIKIN
ncbi:hypothetical protein SteCoe_28262 [Stentor coeruleus]|uniref:Uncharacterized protein n=1 Tax=Stentor coeruleus TaxID=5963 RepID=A0A1R2B8P2_9CILI|nr:hypothetical protein SteCoe_28262 [Stentor coeruleus]